VFDITIFFFKNVKMNDIFFFVQKKKKKEKDEARELELTRPFLGT
jgi:hypothetical protein